MARMTRQPEEGGARLDRLASVGPGFRAPGASFGRWATAPGRFPWFGRSELGRSFLAMLREAGWIIGDFDWPSWTRSTRGQALANDREALARASTDELAMLLTALVRQERFSEGTLARAFEAGLLLAVVERADTLRSSSKAGESHA